MILFDVSYSVPIAFVVVAAIIVIVMMTGNKNEIKANKTLKPMPIEEELKRRKQC